MAETRSEFATTGMHCASCARLIEMTVDELAGVESVSVDLEAATTTVVHDDALAGVEAIIGAIESAGYGVDKG